MSRESEPLPPSYIVEESELVAISQGLVDNFALRFKDPKKVPKGYSVDWEELANGSLHITRKRKFDAYEQLIVSGESIVFIEKKRMRTERTYINTIATVEKAEEFMKKFAPFTDPYSEI